ncbi:MAG: alcohol dehydrogenase catalytic domain-containing protein, partial [Rhodospirillales bacterium]|nr:alcohol dehydrogenase catalytic domain-containing protein [Rhodospirillales bacterium]
MRALCKTDPVEGGIAICDVAPLDPGPDEIRIRTKVAGICGTDMQIYYWAPRMARRMKLPRVLGHEVSGVVETIGADVANVSVGDHVSLESHIFCGQCRPCIMGKAHLCMATTYPGIDINGAFAEYLTVPSSIAWMNPPGLAHETAAMLEPFGIAVHASLEGSGVVGQTVLINGCGPIGLMNIAAARAFGAKTIIASDLNPLRLKTAGIMGADRVVNAGEEDLPAVVSDMTGGNGVDVAIEYSGSEAGFRAVFECLAKGGDFRLVGAPPKAIPVDFTQWLLKCP